MLKLALSKFCLLACWIWAWWGILLIPVWSYSVPVIHSATSFGPTQTKSCHEQIIGRSLLPFFESLGERKGILQTSFETKHQHQHQHRYFIESSIPLQPLWPATPFPLILSMERIAMDGMSSNSSSMTMTMMVFENSMTTPLYSTSWSPVTQGQYAGTCLFLIALAILFRVVIAGKAIQESRWVEHELNRRYEILPITPATRDDQKSDASPPRTEGDKATMLLGADGSPERIVIMQKRKRHLRPWRLSVDPVRAAIDTVLAGIGYLL